MTTPLSNREQLDIAINGSRQFHAKAASANGPVQPDTILDGHREMHAQLTGLAALFGKTAEYVGRGYPARIALDHVASEADVDPEYAEKLASCLDDLGELVLKDLVIETFGNKVREKTAQAGPAATTPKTAQSPRPTGRIDSAVERMNRLHEFAKR